MSTNLTLIYLKEERFHFVKESKRHCVVLRCFALDNYESKLITKKDGLVSFHTAINKRSGHLWISLNQLLELLFSFSFLIFLSWYLFKYFQLTLRVLVINSPCLLCLSIGTRNVWIQYVFKETTRIVCKVTIVLFSSELLFTRLCRWSFLQSVNVFPFRNHNYNVFSLCVILKTTWIFQYWSC